MIPVDLFSMLIGMLVGAIGYWLVTNTNIWVDKTFKDDTKKATTHRHEQQQTKNIIRGQYTTESRNLLWQNLN